MAFDGQDGITGHIRARLTATGHRVGNAGTTSSKARPPGPCRGPSALGLSTGKFIHSGGPTLQQEVDANARRSNIADTGATWTSGFSSVAVIDNSMINQSNALAFAPLANDAMLAVYDNGGGTRATAPDRTHRATRGPTQRLLDRRRRRQPARRRRPGLCHHGDDRSERLGAGADRVRRRFVPTAGMPAARASTRPPTTRRPTPGRLRRRRRPSAPARPSRAAAGFSAHTMRRRPGCSSSTPMPRIPSSTRSMTARPGRRGARFRAPTAARTRGASSRASRSSAADQIGLIWTEGTATFDIFATALATRSRTSRPRQPSTLLEPADGSTVFGDGVDLGQRVGQSRRRRRAVPARWRQYRPAADDFAVRASRWDSRTVGNGTHSIAAMAVDGAGNTSSASASVTVANRPVISAVNATPSQHIDRNRSPGRRTWTRRARVDFGVNDGVRDDGVAIATLVTNHQVTLAGLDARDDVSLSECTSADAAGNAATAGDFTFTTDSQRHDACPTVSITAPANGATVSGTAVTVSATAADNIGVAGVQFMLDGASLGAEDTTSPYSIAWNTYDRARMRSPLADRRSPAMPRATRRRRRFP